MSGWGRPHTVVVWIPEPPTSYFSWHFSTSVRILPIMLQLCSFWVLSFSTLPLKSVQVLKNQYGWRLWDPRPARGCTHACRFHCRSYSKLARVCHLFFLLKLANVNMAGHTPCITPGEPPKIWISAADWRLSWVCTCSVHKRALGRITKSVKFLVKSSY